MRKIIGIVLVNIFLIVAWAPWMGKTYFNEAAARSCGQAPISTPTDNTLSLPGYVDHGYIARYWAPFGRWQVHCRLSWYSLFTGNTLWYVPNLTSLSLPNPSLSSQNTPILGGNKDEIEELQTQLKAAVFAHINKKTAGDWDKIFAITKFNSSQTAAIGTWKASDTWDWLAYKKPNNDWAVLVSLDGFKCNEAEKLTPELQNFFHDILYRFGKKYCY